MLNVGEWSHIVGLSSMQNPKVIEVGAVQGFCSDAAAHALCTWFAIRPIVALHNTGIYANEKQKIEELPVKVQMERLKAFCFAIPSNVVFEVSATKSTCVKDEGERQARFHALIETYIQGRLGKGARSPMKLGSGGYGTTKVTRPPSRL